MAYNEILFEKKNAIATITINRPQAMNAGTIRTWGEIADAFHDAERDNDIRVVVLTGAGRAFCAGDDVKEIFLNPEFRDAKPNTAKDVEEWRTHEPVALDFLIEYPKPTIASVNGAAVGYGCDIALMCDMRVCSDQARFGEVFIRRGLIPEAGGLLVLPRLVGLARAYELILTGDIIDAKEAERIGMVNRVVPHAQLGEATMALATKLAQQAPLAQRLAKEALRVGLNLNLPYFYGYQRHGQHLMFDDQGSYRGREVIRREASRELQGRVAIATRQHIGRHDRAIGVDRDGADLRRAADGVGGARAGYRAPVVDTAPIGTRAELLPRALPRRIVSPHGSHLPVPCGASRGSDFRVAARRSSVGRSHLPMEGRLAHARRVAAADQNHRFPRDQGRQDRAGALLRRRERDLDLHLDVGGEVVHLDAGRPRARRRKNQKPR